jgi:hypothetical protein
MLLRIIGRAALVEAEPIKENIFGAIMRAEAIMLTVWCQRKRLEAEHGEKVRESRGEIFEAVKERQITMEERIVNSRSEMGSRDFLSFSTRLTIELNHSVCRSKANIPRI